MLSLKSSYAGTAPTLARPATRRAVRPRTVTVRADSCLIVNTKGGGHAFIGLHLAKALTAQGHKVTILNDGDPSKIGSKAPYSQYDSLSGVDVVYGDPTDPATYPEGDFEVVYDNNGKSMEQCKPLIDTFKGKVKQFLFVASAGAYVANPVMPCHFEGDPRKPSAGHVEVENYLASEGLPYTVFQPMYIYGPHTNKDCEQWFVDRIVRDRPVCLPGSGMQLASVTHVEDVAAMLAAALGKEAALKQHFNVCSDRPVTHSGMVLALAKALGKAPKIVTYDAYEVELAKGEGLPFRPIHFYADCSKAKLLLDWTPKHTFEEDAPALVAAYQESGRADKSMDFPGDDKVLAAAGSA